MFGLTSFEGNTKLDKSVSLVEPVSDAPTLSTFNNTSPCGSQ
jgi:hypothetical protein